MIVTIDGPAGAGKSSTAKSLAQRLGFHFLDTGAMYRAVALAALESGVDEKDPEEIGSLAAKIEIVSEGGRVLLQGVDVTDRIRSPEVTVATHIVADHPAVRERLVTLQRQIVAGKDFVTEGRDQGTEAFPDARCKIFLTATPEERARRRARERPGKGDWREVLEEQNARDRRDLARPIGRLRRAEDAIEVKTDGLTQEEVVDQLEEIVRAARNR
jgi:cytidylate kinase